MKQYFLYKISLAEVAEVLVGELETVAEEALGTAPNAVDLVERSAKKGASGGEKKVEVVCLADAEGDERDSDEDPEILESAVICFISRRFRTPCPFLT